MMIILVEMYTIDENTIFIVHKLLCNCPIDIFCVVFLTFTCITCDLNISVSYILGQICITIKNISALLTNQLILFPTDLHQLPLRLLLFIIFVLNCKLSVPLW